ncbi:hypothetical protein SDC9_176890 [bioreactor metagenome]|uniref:Uncharacterized protein n=1 Tax=bioreactor metagenome TaxID=1076179 RepID=A0A645GRB0_9ZZZZ
MHAIFQRFLGGQHQNRDTAHLTYPSANFNAIHARQHPIEHHQIRMVIAIQIQAALAIQRSIDLVAFIYKRASEYL